MTVVIGRRKRGMSNRREVPLSTVVGGRVVSGEGLGGSHDSCDGGARSVS
jgi:hypothetical protein